MPLDFAAAAEFDPLVCAALREDIGEGDVTTAAVVDDDPDADAEIVFRSRGVVAGIAVAARAFALLDPHIMLLPLAADGARVASQTAVARLRGPVKAILSGERVALNFLARLSGVATLTAAYVDALGASTAHIVDTRKTTPGLRALERYAVRAGGGSNHRFDLHEAALIKDNHIAAVGSVSEAIRRVRDGCASDVIIQCECDSLGQVAEALAAGVDALLLDNMSLEHMRQAVALARGRAMVEASGCVRLERVREIGLAGVDVISVGALTHSAKSVDVGLDFTKGA